MNLGELTGLLAVLLGGLTILTPILAISTRFALKPLLESMARLRLAQNTEELRALNTKKVEMLEAELDQLRRTVNTLVATQEFDRQLHERAVGQSGSRAIGNGLELHSS